MATTKKQIDSYFDPRDCSYRLSRKIRDHVDELIRAHDIDQNLKSAINDLIIEDESNKNKLGYDSLVKLHKYISRADPKYTEPFYLFSENCKCIRPKPRENKELENRLKLLRLRASQRMYDKMTSSVDRSCEEKVERLADGLVNNDTTKPSTVVSEFKNLSGSVIAVFNSFLVFICTFIFFFKAIEYALPQPNIIAQVACGLGASTIVAIAELYFIVRVI